MIDNAITFSKQFSSHKTTDYVGYVQLHVFHTVLSIFNILYIILSTFMYKIPIYQYVQVLIVNPS